MATTDTEPAPLGALMRRRRTAVDQVAEGERLIAAAGPVSLGFHLETIRDDVYALQGRLDALAVAIEAAGVAAVQVDIPAPEISEVTA